MSALDPESGDLRLLTQSIVIPALGEAERCLTPLAQALLAREAKAGIRLFHILAS
jgi:hypothetical protein